MKKSDLRTGMLVTLRNKEMYYVMLNTGIEDYTMCSETNNVLIHCEGKSTGWMSLDDYNEDMCFHDPDNGMWTVPGDDRDWDIMFVNAVTQPQEMFRLEKYQTIWEREE